MLKELIGAQILSIEGNLIKIKKEGKVHFLEIISDNGDCCGYAEFHAELLISEGSLNNPIITNVESKEDDVNYGCFSNIITFYGESKEIAKIESNVGSGSGWQYGACVTIICKNLDIEEELATW